MRNRFISILISDRKIHKTADKTDGEGLRRGDEGRMKLVGAPGDSLEISRDDQLETDAGTHPSCVCLRSGVLWLRKLPGARGMFDQNHQR